MNAPTINNVANIEQEIENRDLEREALELRRAGHTYRSIAKLQNCSVGAAHNRVSRAIAAYLPKETVAEARAVELDRLDELVDLARDIAHGADDDETRLKAIDRLMKIADRRAKLLGLDAPVNAKVDMTTTVTADDIRRYIAQGVARRADP